ncbi:unnamed protein product [Echinostoma caproni]|uniref:Uncharacterized protein n=1 Tax=Echinostoma caproni TaxID=27848 RepID=A0A183AM64_9TREM|nr:unnamed protein product [Echinostoma caproni]
MCNPDECKLAVHVPRTRDLLASTSNLKLPKHIPTTANPRALASLLSLLPPTPESHADRTTKSRTHRYRRPFKSISRQSSVPSLASPATLARKHSTSKLSHSAMIAEMDVRHLASRVSGTVQRKSSTKSLNAEFIESPHKHISSHQFGVRTPYRSYSASHSLDCAPVY